MTTKLAILVSDGGDAILQDLLDATRINALDAEIVIVVADAELPVLRRAEKANVPVHLPAPNAELSPTLERHKPSLVVLAAWPHALDNVLRTFPYRVIDVRPGLPKQPIDTEEIFASFQRGEITETGLTVYFVAEDDTIGSTILSVPVMLYKQDALENFERRVRQVEPHAVIRALQRLTEGD